MMGSSGKNKNDLMTLVNFFGDPDKVKESIGRYYEAIDKHEAAVEDHTKVKQELDSKLAELDSRSLTLDDRENELLQKGSELAEKAKQLAVLKLKLEEDQRQVEIAYDHSDALYEDAKHDHENIINKTNEKAKEILKQQQEITKRILDEALKKDQYSTDMAKKVDENLKFIDEKIRELKQREVDVSKREEAVFNFVKNLSK